MKICIFCGASKSLDPDVNKYVQEVMNDFYKNQIELVYGGAGIGIMGDLANHLMDLGGRVTGVIPRRLMKSEVGKDQNTLQRIEDKKRIETENDYNRQINELKSLWISIINFALCLLAKILQ
jgi:predicted Rossmann-fold nucleotide-binding protein